MSNFKLASSLELPAAIAGRRTAIFGISGSGKSNTATLIVEQLLHAGEQVVLIDPKGESWGLLSTAAGKPSNLPIIVFGEPNGHIETLNETHGPRLADFVVETGRSVSLSMLGFESDQAERRFVATFLRQLYRRKSRQGQPTRTLVVLEEAHLFIPENVRGDAAELAGAAQRIARQGRTYGIGTLIVDQRPQDVSKRVITQCDTLICHQLVHKTDRDALREWVRGYDVDGRGEKFLESIATLEPGEAWIWSPAWLKVFERVKIHRRKTYDSGATPDGSAAARTVQRAEVDLDALRGQLAEVVETAKANDPAELKRKVAELEKQLRERPAETKTVEVEKIVEVPVLNNGQLERVESILEKLAAVSTEATERVNGLKQAIVPATAPRSQSVPNAHIPNTRTPTTPQPNVIPKAVLPPRPPQPPTTTVTGGSGDLTGPQQAILDTILMLNTRGIVANRDSIARWLDIHPNGGSYGTNLGFLRSNGYLDGCRLTEKGGATARPQETGIEAALRALPDEPKRKIIRVLLEIQRALSREELALSLGIHPNGGSYGTNLGRLRTMGLITERGPIAPTEGLRR
jgi:hypothetical protein